MSAKKRLDYLDYAKGFSILAIVLFHYLRIANLSDPFNKAIFYGGAGVHLFFFLSGFGLNLSRTPISVIEFFKKRFFRIYIPYVIAIICIATFDLFMNGTFDIYAFFGHLMLYKMFDASIVSSYGGHMWFMSTIFQLYIAYPLIIYLFKRFDHKWLFFSLALTFSFAWNAFLIVTDLSDNRIWGSFFIQYLWEFVLGIVAAEYIKSGKFQMDRIKISHLLPIFFISIALMVILVFKVEHGKTINDYFSFMSFAALTLIAFKCYFFRFFLIFVGKISLEVYLLHMLVVSIVFALFSSEVMIYPAIVVACVVTVVSGYAYNRAILSAVRTASSNNFKRVR